MVAAQVANGIDRRHYPQETRQQGKQHTQRFDLETDRQSGQGFCEIDGRPGTVQDSIVQ